VLQQTAERDYTTNRRHTGLKVFLHSDHIKGWKARVKNSIYDRKRLRLKDSQEDSVLNKQLQNSTLPSYCTRLQSHIHET